MAETETKSNADSNSKSNADVVDEIGSLIEAVDELDPLQGNDGFNRRSKSRLIEALRQVAQELDETDPAISSIREAAREATKCGIDKEVQALERDIRQLLERESVHLFPRGLFKAKKDIVAFVFVWIALGAIPIVLVWFGTFLPIASKEATSVAGTIGDAFGMSNAFFSGLALLFVAATMFLQRKELMLQRNELRLTRDEMRRSSNSQDEQAKRLESAARIASLSQIYHHYDTFTTSHGKSQIAQAVAMGKKRWTVRHLHMLIESDEKLRANSRQQIKGDASLRFNQLRESCLEQCSTLSDVQELAGWLSTLTEHVAALMADECIEAKVRERLYELYDVIWAYDSTFNARPAGGTFRAGQSLSPPQKQWISRFSQSSKAVLEAAL